MKSIFKKGDFMQYAKIISVLTFIDQIAKTIVSIFLKPVGSFEIMPGIFYLTYSENTGAAFGLFKNNRMPLIVCGTVIAIILAYHLIENYKNGDMIVNFAISAIIGGILGNLIDRIRLGYVIDFFNISLIHYPIFNFADMLIAIGAITLVYIVINKKTLLNDNC